jgi:hypothetical protein
LPYCLARDGALDEVSSIDQTFKFKAACSRVERKIETYLFGVLTIDELIFSVGGWFSSLLKRKK